MHNILSMASLKSKSPKMLTEEQAKEIIDDLHNKGNCVWFESYYKYMFHFSRNEDGVIVKLSYGGDIDSIYKFNVEENTPVPISKYENLGNDWMYLEIHTNDGRSFFKELK